MQTLHRLSLLGLWLLALAISSGRQEQKRPTAAELSENETPGKAIVRMFDQQKYEFRSVAEDKWSYQPVPGLFKNDKPEFGPAEVRTFAEQVKHVACANFAFAAELDGAKTPGACDKGGPNPARTRAELLRYLRDSFSVLKKSLTTINAQKMYDPIEGPYAGPNTRFRLGCCLRLACGGSLWSSGHLSPGKRDRTTSQLAQSASA